MKSITALCLGATLMVVGCGDSDPVPTVTPTATPTATQAAVLDVRLEPPAAPASGGQWLTPDYEVPPFSERQFCYYFTYNGPDVGVVKAEEFQDPTYGHHVIMLKANVSTDDYPDGSWFDCTSLENMVDMEPIYIADKNPEAGYHLMQLPTDTEAGLMASSLKSGTRLVVQSHYVNYSDKTLMVRDAVNLYTVEPSAVETWAGSWSHTDIDLRLPPNATTTLEVRCTWEDDVTLLNMFGHMHEMGQAISIDFVQAGSEARERVYDISQWLPEMRDAFPVVDFELGAFQVHAGDTFITTCTWFNDTDTETIFPQEMCASAGMVFPTKVPMICEAE